LSKHGEYTIRKMNQAELGRWAIEWASQEGWNPGLNDAESFYAADADGFLVGMLGDDPVGSISAVKYGADFAFLGLYIVRPEHRGKGCGLRLWDAAMARAEGSNVGLDGVVEQQGNYRKSGFHLAYSNIRHEGVAQSAPGASPHVTELQAVDLSAVMLYDRQVFPAPRPAFLRAWLAQHQGLALAAVVDGALAGYSVARPCRAGWKIGPLFADSAAVCEELFLATCHRLEPGTKFYLDTPEVNPAAMALAQRHGMTEVFSTARMYTAPPPDIDLAKVFGVTTFELG